MEKKWKHLRTAGVICGLLCAVSIFILSSIPSQSFPEAKDIWSYAIHFSEYTCLGICLVFALSGRKGSWKWVLVLAVALASLYGVSDELHQLLVPGRCCDVRDWVTDTCGALLGAGCTIFFLVRCHWFPASGRSSEHPD